MTWPILNNELHDLLKATRQKDVQAIKALLSRLAPGSTPGAPNNDAP